MNLIVNPKKEESSEIIGDFTTMPNGGISAKKFLDILKCSLVEEN